MHQEYPSGNPLTFHINPCYDVLSEMCISVAQNHLQYLATCHQMSCNIYVLTNHILKCT